MPTAKCNKCNVDYEFKEAWFKKHDLEEFVCRKCKIRIRTQSSTYRKEQSRRSKAALSDPNVKERMSQRATLNNIHNADKISQSVKDYYADHNNRERAKKRSKKKWQNPKYREMVSEGLKRKWQDPEYRGKILGSRAHYKKHNNKLQAILTDLGFQFVLGYTIAMYEFDAVINEIYLYDEQYSREKEMFIDHYFKNMIYINNLDSIPTSES